MQFSPPASFPLLLQPRACLKASWPLSISVTSFALIGVAQTLLGVSSNNNNNNSMDNNNNEDAENDSDISASSRKVAAAGGSVALSF